MPCAGAGSSSGDQAASQAADATSPEKEEAGQKGPLAPAPEPTEVTLLVEASAEAARSADRALDKDVHFGETYEYRAQRVARVTVDGRYNGVGRGAVGPVRWGCWTCFHPRCRRDWPRWRLPERMEGQPAIDLSWQPDTETDLAGYIVYRREGSGDWQRISPAQPVVGPAFQDAHVQPGHSYSYSVSAIDQGGHESGRSSEAEETVPGP